MKKKLHEPIDFNGLNKLLAKLPYEAAKHATDSQRHYLLNGQRLDAELIDHAVAVSNRFLESGILSDHEMDQVRTSRWGLLWGVGRRADAARDVEELIRFGVKSGASVETMANLRKALALILQGGSPLDMLD